MHAALLLALATAAGCYSPSIPDSTYRCNDPDRTCPAGLVCNSCLYCVHADSALDAGACQSCGHLAQCYIDRTCRFGDTACAQSCSAKGTARAQQLAQVALDCLTTVCAPRCGIPELPNCTSCTDNVARGPGSPAGLCSPPTDPACGQCVPAYNNCLADRSGI
jgi:hypothetical protein